MDTETKQIVLSVLKGRERFYARRVEAIRVAIRELSSPTAGVLDDGETDSGPTAQHLAETALRSASGPLRNRQIREIMFQLGWATKSSNPDKIVATTLQRLATAGRIQKVDTGLWALPEEEME